MTQITIPIRTGPNYISFPATSTETFNTIFISSGIMERILSFKTYDPTLGLIDVSYYETIEKGKGYILTLDVISQGTISFIGEEYSITFNELKSRILRGSNLIGPGNIPITLQPWCRVIDADTNIPVNIIEPQHAYWITYADCIQPTTEAFLFISVIGLGIAMISLFVSLRSKNITNQ